jgi:ATP-dependent RNA helicase DDX51/DBP6
MVVCETAQKPMILFHLIHTHSVKNAIIFTKSAESTTRLMQLFQFFESSRFSSHSTVESDQPVVMQAYSSDLSPADRRTVLDKFKNTEIHL